MANDELEEVGLDKMCVILSLQGTRSGGLMNPSVVLAYAIGSNNFVNLWVTLLLFQI